MFIMADYLARDIGRGGITLRGVSFSGNLTLIYAAFEQLRRKAQKIPND